jgi:hypothetical protein
MNRIQRCLAVMAGLGGTLLALAAAVAVLLDRARAARRRATAATA